MKGKECYKINFPRVVCGCTKIKSIKGIDRVSGDMKAG